MDSMITATVPDPILIESYVFDDVPTSTTIGRESERKTSGAVGRMVGPGDDEE